MNPAAHRVIAPRQVPGVVSVQALDTPSGAAHTTGRSMSDMVGGNRRIPFIGVPLVSLDQLDRVAGRLGISDPSDRFEGANAGPENALHQPEAGGHGATVVKQRMVADDHRITAVVADHDLEGALRTATQQRLDDSALGRPVIVQVHRRRSSIVSTSAGSPGQGTSTTRSGRSPNRPRAPWSPTSGS